MDYLDINVAAGYLYTEKTLKPYVGAGLYFSILLNAEQRMLGATYDIKDSKVIEKHDLGINLFTGMQYQYSENAAAFIEMGYGLGLNQLELNSETDSQQKMNNRLFYLQMGLHFSINKPKTEEETN
jgi:outer membrane protein W